MLRFGLHALDTEGQKVHVYQRKGHSRGTCFLPTIYTDRRRSIRYLLPLGFPRLDPDASDVQLLRGFVGLRQEAAELLPQVIPGLTCPLPGESDLQEIPQVFLGVDQEGVGGIQAELLHSTK